jgi:hypothetical protein
MSEYWDKAKERFAIIWTKVSAFAVTAFSQLDRLRDPMALRAPEYGYVPVREHPKGTKLIGQAQGYVHLQFKAALRFWWKFYYLMLAGCVAATFFGAFVGFAVSMSNASNLARRGVFADPGSFEVWVGAIIGFVITLIPTIYVYRWTHPWVDVYAQSTSIKVATFNFDRKYYGGFRVGYELQTTVGMLKNDFHDIDLGLQGLRFCYGQWGEDLPYLVSKYHANEIVMWINQKIAETEPKTTAPVTESGQRPQRFE